MTNNDVKAQHNEGVTLLQKLRHGPGGVVMAAVLVVLAGACFYYFVISGEGQSSIAADAGHRVFIDTDGKLFDHDFVIGEFPANITNPATGKHGFPAEWCWWTKDGKIRSEPYPVMLNEHVGKPGPTYCPDCGRLVVLHNPSPKAPGASQAPPPTAADRAAR